MTKVTHPIIKADIWVYIGVCDQAITKQLD